MAKRARGSVRPGQRPPIQRRTTGPSAAVPPPAPTPRPPAGLTEAELARAAELEAQLVAGERSAEEARNRAQVRARTVREPVAAGGGSLAVRAADEYAYVARDVRRITRIASLLLAILFALWIAIDVAKVVSIS